MFPQQNISIIKMENSQKGMALEFLEILHLQLAFLHRFGDIIFWLIDLKLKTASLVGNNLLIGITTNF